MRAATRTLGAIVVAGGLALWLGAGAALAAPDTKDLFRKWEVEGTENDQAFTGSVTITDGGDGELDLSAALRLADGTEISWKAVGRYADGRITYTYERDASVGIAGRLDGVEAGDPLEITGSFEPNALATSMRGEHSGEGISGSARAYRPGRAGHGLRWTPSVLADVLVDFGLEADDEDAFLLVAADHDANDNGFLSKPELREAARAMFAGREDGDGDAEEEMEPGEGEGEGDAEDETEPGEGDDEAEVIGTDPVEDVEIGLISDLDKTIIPPERRRVQPPPYPGITALVNALEGEKPGDVSFVTARKAERVTEVPAWLEEHGIPTGPIETGVSGIPWVAEPEKVRDCEAILGRTPRNQRFVFLGDSSQRDPAVYKTIQARHPSRFAVGVIHIVTDDPRDAERFAGLHAVANWAEGAAALFGAGVLDEAAARRVMKSARDEGLEIDEDAIDALIEAQRDD